MRRKTSSSSPAWLLLVVVLPLLWLVYLAWQGTRNQEQLIAGVQGDEANRLVRGLAEQLQTATTTRAKQIAKYPDPPLPGAPSPLDEVLSAGDPAALREMCYDPGAGISPAGLPRQALAVLRLRQNGAELNDATAVKVLTETSPSTITGQALQSIHAGQREIETWEDFERLLPAVEKRPDLGWVFENGQCAWLTDSGDHWSYLSRYQVRSTLKFFRPNTDDFTVRLSTGTSYPRSAESPGLLATYSLKNGNGVRLEIYATGYGRYDDLSAQARRWGLLSLGGAVSVCILGIYLMHRTLTRERRLSDMKSQFVASVSHELRSPVASIRLMAEALDAGKVDTATAANFHRLIAREGARLSTLVGNVLDHARIEQGRRIWKMQPCNLAELVTDTCRVMEPLARERDIALTVVTLPIDSAVDAGAIQQALVNLLDNAIKFSPPGGAVAVELTTHEKSRSWELRVTDHGPGIPRKEQSRIFERFYRPGDELRRETQGTGIGLSLVKAIATAHDGAVLVESEPGHGSTFILRLPTV